MCAPHRSNRASDITENVRNTGGPKSLVCVLPTALAERIRASASRADGGPGVAQGVL
jgi:hypothetical protein